MRPTSTPGAILSFGNPTWVVMGLIDQVCLLRPLTGTSEDLLAGHRLTSTLLGFHFPSEHTRLCQIPFPES